MQAGLLPSVFLIPFSLLHRGKHRGQDAALFGTHIYVSGTGAPPKAGNAHTHGRRFGSARRSLPLSCLSLVESISKAETGALTPHHDEARGHGGGGSRGAGSQGRRRVLMARVGEGIGLDLSPVIHALFQGEECDVSVLTFR